MQHLSLAPSAPYFPTASELRIASECVAPWALGLPEERETNEWAELGRRMHAAAECLALGKVRHEHFDAPSERALEHVMCSLDDDIAAAKVFVWPDGRAAGIRAEMGIKWRSDGFDDEAELRQRAPGERLRGWFSGTADLVYVRTDGVLVVVDWKFGPREHVYGEPAKESCQGFFLAVAFASLLKISGSSAGVVVARFERRMVREDGTEVDGYDITQGELDAFAEQLRGLGERIQRGVDVAPRISAACGKCKARRECPAWEMQSHVVYHHVANASFDALKRPPQSPDDARALHYAIEQGEHLTAEWKKWRDAYVLTNGPVSVGLGMALKAVPQSKRAVVSTPEAMDLIEQVAGKSAIVIERNATCDSIKKAARDAAGAGIVSTSDRNKAKAAAEAEVFAKLIEGGAIREAGKTYVVREMRTGDDGE